MLAAIGVGSVAELFERQIPAPVRLGRALDLPAGLPEQEVYEHLRALAARNVSAEEELYVPRGGDVRPLRACADRHADGALGVPHALHPLPARGLPGGAAGHVRVPDGDLRADRPAGLQRLDVRGALRRRRRRVPRQAAQRPRAASWSARGCTPTRSRRCAPTRTAIGVEVVEVPLLDGRTDPEAWAAAIDADTGAAIFAQPNFYGAVEDAPALSAAAKAGRGGAARCRRAGRSPHARPPRLAG